MRGRKVFKLKQNASGKKSEHKLKMNILKIQLAKFPRYHTTKVLKYLYMLPTSEGTSRNVTGFQEKARKFFKRDHVVVVCSSSKWPFVSFFPNFVSQR